MSAVPIYTHTCAVVSDIYHYGALDVYNYYNMHGCTRGVY